MATNASPEKNNFYKVKRFYMINRSADGTGRGNGLLVTSADLGGFQNVLQRSSTMDCACVGTQPRWMFLMVILALIQSGCHGNQGTPTVRTIRAMSGDTVTLPASYDVSMPVIAVTWNRLEGPESESTRVGVYMYSPRANGSLSMSLGPLKGRATLHPNGSLTG
ncbi:uncharacterized protein LOC144903697 [Branchiostoma floridae x Branchiostoma belcheri]